MNGFLISFPLASIATAMGARTASHKKAVINGTLSAIAYFIVASVLLVGQLANVELILNKEIPLLVLANVVYSFFANIFVFILLVGIYVTSILILWEAVEKFSEEQTKK